jgi:hypothetical protein
MTHAAVMLKPLPSPKRPVHNPFAVCLPFRTNLFDGFGKPRIGLGPVENGSASKIIERAQDVVSIPVGMGEVQISCVYDLTSAQAPKEVPAEQVFFAMAPCTLRLRRRAEGALILQEAFQHVDR